ASRGGGEPWGGGGGPAGGAWVFTARRPHPPAGGGGSEPIAAVPVTIRNPDQPIGTHIFTAMAKTDNGLQWSFVTINDAGGAKSALDRVTIPQEVLDRIAPTASARSSIIISDEALSPETGTGTELGAVLSNEPQGGLAMRKHPSEVRYARQRYVFPQYGYAPQRDRPNYWRSPYSSYSTW